MESHKENWEFSKRYEEFNQMRQGTSKTFTVSEGVDSEGASHAPSSVSFSTYSNLVVDSEEFCQQFMAKVRIRDNFDDSFMDSSGPRDAGSTLGLSRKRRYSPGRYGTRGLRVQFKLDSDLCSNRDYREASGDSSRRVGSHYFEPESNASMALMRRAFAEPIPDSSTASASSQDKSAGPLSFERERRSIPVNAQLSLDSTSSNIISAPTYFDVAIEQNLDGNNNTRTRKMAAKRVDKRNRVRRALFNSFEELKKNE